MAKQKKKGQSGQAKNYITRTQAVRKLQISLPDFRRLCIFKGIYPREPRNLKKANKSATHSTTFYYTKDIQYLLHEPLLVKLRDQKALQKKIAKSLGRNEVQDAVRLERQGAQGNRMKLDHIVRERYPTFIDALRDLDDALSLLFLFASLPATESVPLKVISRCQRLTHEFEHYLIATNSLKKSFLSIKGIYYQCTIKGQDIMWLVPYKFVQRVTGDVDYRIMGTFVEFYCTLLGFVNYRLYTSIGLVYPPKFDTLSDERGAELAAFTLEGRNLVDHSSESGDSRKAITNGHAQTSNPVNIQAQIDAISKDTDTERDTNIQGDERAEAEDEPQQTSAIDKFTPQAPSADDLPQPQASSDAAARLFKDLTFYISREAPRHPIEFLLRAFGCKRIGWDRVVGEGAYTFDETDLRITHQIVDKPLIIAGKDGTVQTGRMNAGRTYIQPQWIWDCVNESALLRTDLYAPGATLPPHLSPWMKPIRGQYDPRATLKEQELEGEAEEDLSEGEAQQLLEGAEPDKEEEDEEEGEAEIDGQSGGMTIDVEDDDSAAEEEIDNSFGDFDETAETQVDESDIEDDHQAELAAEAAGSSLAVKKPQQTEKDRRKQERALKQRREDEEVERQKMMMSNKKRKLYEKMQYGNAAKDAEAEKLRKKRRKIEQQQQQQRKSKA